MKDYYVERVYYYLDGTISSRYYFFDEFEDACSEFDLCVDFEVFSDLKLDAFYCMLKNVRDNKVLRDTVINF